MRYLSVCSGIEAASVAWHPLGWRPFAFSEIEKFPSRVLAHHYPDTPNFGDMTKFQEWPDATIDVLVGGTPCQSFSVAGLRAGLADPRGNLMLTYLAIADKYRPRWLVWENVPGVLSSNGGRDFGALLGGLAKLGYGFAYRILDAQYVRVDGLGRAVPQRRRRVFVVGCLGDWRRAAAVLFERESLRGNPAPSRKAGEGVAGTIESCLGRSGTSADFAAAGGLQQWPADVATTLDAHFGDKLGLENQHVNAGARSSLPQVSLCLNAGAMGRIDAESETLIPIGGCFGVAHSLRADGFDASEDGTGRGTPLVPVAYSIMPMNSGKDYKARETDVAQPIMAAGPAGGNQGGDYIVPISFSGQMSVPQVDFGLSQTLQAKNPQAVAIAIRGRDGGATAEIGDDCGHALRASQGGGDKAHVLLSMGVRRLTPRECERLQGFPDDYTAIPGAADGPRYKALGNSMAVNVMRWIGTRIAMVDTIQKSEERAAA